MNKYAERDAESEELRPLIMEHLSAMTAEGLHSKSAIAHELAYRDLEIKKLKVGAVFYTAAPTKGDLLEEVTELRAKLKAAEQLKEKLKQEAQIHAQEARTQRATVHDCYQAVGAQKGDGNGAEPVRDKINELQEKLKAAEAKAAERGERMGIMRDWRIK